MESITGIATNVCVESTARDSFMRDYHVVIPSGLTEGTSADAKKLALANIDTFFGEVVDSEGLLRCWNLGEWSGYGRRHHSHHRAIKGGNNV
jgi:nicotinamidase-related amidase